MKENKRHYFSSFINPSEKGGAEKSNLVRLISAGGISVFILPVNISFQ